MQFDDVKIDAPLVSHLIAQQFPKWASLPLTALAQGGWCNRTFRLGDNMLVRLPRALAYAPQVAKEVEWLPKLAPQLHLSIPCRLAMGVPDERYPWHWAIYEWIEGDIATPENVVDAAALAADLGRFLAAMYAINPRGGPPSGAHSFYRGGLLGTYDLQTRNAVALLGKKIDADTVIAVWNASLQSTWTKAPVWVHGDISAANLLVRNGKLCAVIDFGNLSVGDPACDLACAWATFRSEARQSLRAALPLDADTWARGRGWALWKALILASGMSSSNAYEASRPWEIIEEVLADHLGKTSL